MNSLRCFLLTEAGIIACPGVAGIWIANSWSEQRGGIEKAGLWPLSCFRKPCWLQRIVLITLATLQKKKSKKKASVFAKVGAALPVGMLLEEGRETWLQGGCWDFRHHLIYSYLEPCPHLFSFFSFPPALFSSELWGWEWVFLEKIEGEEKNLDGDTLCVQDVSTCIPSLHSSAAPKGLTIWEATCYNCFHETVSTG